MSTKAHDTRGNGHTPESAARLELALDEVLTPLGSMIRAIQVARCHATRCRTAPDPVALFYDLARLDVALELLEAGSARIVSIIRSVTAPVDAAPVDLDDSSFS